MKRRYAEYAAMVFLKTLPPKASGSR